MLRFFKSLFADPGGPATDTIQKRRDRLAVLSEGDLRAIAALATDLDEVIAVAAVAASRILGLDLFDVQVQGALALAGGRVAEMQTGEGKTLTAVPAVIWYARNHSGVHAMTVNDYLARRDAQWMGDIYRFFGLSVGVIQQGMSAADRRDAYSCDITYATANEIGFDFLRDQLALYPAEQVHRPFSVAVIDEADSILIDEARIPLVIAGGDPLSESLAARADRITRTLHLGLHYRIEEYGRNVTLTDAGIQAVEVALGCGNSLQPRELRNAHRGARFAARADAAASRYRLRCEEWRGRIGG